MRLLPLSLPVSTPTRLLFKLASLDPSLSRVWKSSISISSPHVHVHVHVHVLLQHRNDHQGQVPARVPVPAPTSVRDPMSALMNVAAERSLAVGTPTPSEGDSGRATLPLSEMGSASEVGLEA